MEDVCDLQEQSESHYALLFRFSKLQERYKSPYQIKIAVNILNDLFKGQRGRIYTLKDSDIVLIHQGTDKPLLERAIFQLRYLFMDDQIAYSDDGYENPNFCSVYDLEFQWHDFFLTCKAKLAEDEDTSAVEKDTTKHTSDKKRQLLTPKYLANILNPLKEKGIEGAIRTQPICAVVVRDQRIASVYDEIYFNIRHLEQILDTDVDLLSSKTLFHYLTRSLDKQLLTHLVQTKKDPRETPLSINLNLRSLFSEEFSVFDASLSPVQKKSVIIEVQISEILSEVRQFIIARETIQKMGYRICIDGLYTETLAQIDRASLGCDLVKLIWDPEVLKSGNVSRELITKAVKRSEPTRVILCRCDDESAIDFGRSIGISLFQGRYLDSRLNPNSTIVN